MAGQENDDTGNSQSATLHIDTTPALASINYNALVAPEKGASSDDEPHDAPQIPVEDVRSAIGVSISREQTRLTSAQTPAVEKAAAIERAGGFFGATDGAADTLVEEPEEEEQDVETPREEFAQIERDEIPQPSPSVTPVRLPSPWRVESKARWQTGGKGRQGLFDGIFNRRRASSGPEGVSSDSWQKSILSSLPSIPKPFSVGLPFTSSNDSKVDATATKSVADTSNSSTSQAAKTSSAGSVLNSKRLSDGVIYAKPRRTTVGSDSDTRRQLSPQEPQLRAKALRRSTSDHSLTTLRTLSVVESLGDDSRFEDVSAQVNSRLQAIKDSWQDASISLPSLPSISVSNFTPGFFRERSGSLNKRQSLALPPSNNGTMVSQEFGRHQSNVRPVDPMTRQPYTSAKGAVSDATSGKTISHPHFTRALEQLEGDVVVLGGYRGSILRSADPPHRQIWVPVKVGLNLRKVNLEVGFEDGDDGRATETVIPGGMLTHIGPVDMARRLLKRLRNCKNAQTGKLRVHEYGYDWRLDPIHLSNGLIKFIEGLPCNKARTPKEKRGATILAHSLGGLITRHAVNRQPDLFRSVVYAGVPHTCVNILGPLRNGDEVLLSDRVLTAQVNFSIRTSFALLPLDGRCFFDKKTREEYRVDFFDPQTWLDYRLSPCVARPLPPLAAPAKPGGISGYVSSMASALPSLPGRGRKSSPRARNPADPAKSTVSGALEPDMADTDNGDTSKVMANGNIEAHDYDTSISPRTAVTVSHEKAMEYLRRALASVKKFKEELAFVPAHAEANLYPPVAVIYGKTTPTVYGAKVDGREGIKHADAYDELAFASGDGVVLARAAQVPQGYTIARGGVVSSERGHVTLLSDLEAVGKCLNAVIGARMKGVGHGM
jgi:pimeloyl-ACP methyl ester carboxylesterase